MDLKLKNKKVLVTGAGSGIGREIARQFAEEGAYVLPPLYCSSPRTLYQVTLLVATTV